MSNLFDSTTWTGEFFHPDLFESRFSGTLKYSPAGGVLLTYRKVDDGKVPSTPVLQGVLDSGDMCTLFGTFAPSGLGFSVRNGLYSTHGQHGFALLIVGAFVRGDYTVDDITFTLSGLQDFLVHPGGKNAVKFQNEAVHSTPLPFGTLELRTSATFGFLPKDVSAAIYTHDEEAMEDLIETFSTLQQRHPKTIFMQKKELEYNLRLRLTQPTPVLEAYKHIADICNLFALLLDSPTYPERINVRMADETVGDVTVPVYPSLGLNPATVELAQRKKTHVLMPINASNLALPDVLASWLTSDMKKSILVSAKQHEVGFRTDHSAHGDIVLYASQLESISYAAKRTREKYEYPIQEYGTADLVSVLERTLNVKGLGDIAVAISDLRNEIAHVGRRRTYLERMRLRDLMQVARCLELVLTAYTLRRIGVPDSLTNTYVDKLLPRDQEA